MATRIAIRPRRLALLLVLAALTLALVACGPEASRARGDGRATGADLDNWGAPVQMHGSQQPSQRIYYETPIKAPAT